MDRDTVTPTPHQLRALAHPVRLRMLGMLRMDGPATATSLAARLGLNTGATSYHLRQLAQHGFVVDDAERGNGRERWWKAAHTSTRTDTGVTSTPDDPAAGETVDAYLQSVVTVYTEWLQRAVEERPLLPQAWRDAGTFSDWHKRLTPASAERLLERIDALLTDLEDDDDPEALAYMVNLNAFVRPGQVGGDDE
ncbi:ArsR/SmtB family transcription factor [Nocardioides rubriscoriae]|uniref:ArsR/SmtB family transcription factor n=1 Tax=Nocardioides rubriscoriae TaxID=642762 RepID=UPI0011DFAC91|nr:metalloregulator ArsR/SmtB family transcription factor [Nocardioides rubriscoriae]